jgi:2-polyprenyl-6-methoxyphenol hydroxylase-like FAD-dependent oxidoreductase
MRAAAYYTHPPEWSRKLFQPSSTLRLALIGDAAHSMTPMQGEGGNSALEDALVVADAIKIALDAGSLDVPL